MQRVRQRVTRLLKNRLVLAVVLVAVVTIPTAVLVVVTAGPAKKTHVVAPEDQVVTSSSETPDEVKPTSSYKWLGRDNDPKKIKIPSIGVDAYLQKVGVDQNHNVAVPTNVHIGGWFVDSVRPGEKGLSIIDGHYDGSKQSEAVFKNLANVTVGDDLTIEFGDGSTKTFRIAKTTTTTIADAPSVLFSQEPSATNQLNLITCGGKYDRTGKTYDHRVIVTAQLVK